MPFEELAHTADWAMRARAANLPELFAESARGMNALTGARPLNTVEEARLRMHRTMNLSAPDAESLLVAFLSELVYAAEQENLMFDEFEIQVVGEKLKVEMSGAPIASINKSIKAVTYHNLKIREVEGGVEVEIVFDV
jgi:SHS2 domain-containing protein